MRLLELKLGIPLAVGNWQMPLLTLYVGTDTRHRPLLIQIEVSEDW